MERMSWQYPKVKNLIFPRKSKTENFSLGRFILRIKKKSTISRSKSQSSFQSCHDEEEDKTGGDNDDDEYTWQTPTIYVHNILFGRLWCEFQGQIDISHIQSNQRSVLTIKSHSWFGSKTTDMFKFTGFIYDGTFYLDQNFPFLKDFL